MNETTFSLSRRRIPVERKTPTVKRDVNLDMESCQNHISDEDSGWSEMSDDFSTDLDRFDTAYNAIRGLADDLRRLPRGTTSEDASGVLLEGGWEKLQDLVHLPGTWPLARPTAPLEGLSKQIDRLLEGYCLQILATNRDSEVHNRKVLQMASHLTWILAEYLAQHACVAHAYYTGA